jgi:hypothetical protein
VTEAPQDNGDVVLNVLINKESHGLR